MGDSSHIKHALVSLACRRSHRLLARADGEGRHLDPSILFSPIEFTVTPQTPTSPFRIASRKRDWPHPTGPFFLRFFANSKKRAAASRQGVEKGTLDHVFPAPQSAVSPHTPPPSRPTEAAC